MGTRPLSGPAPLTSLARKRAWLRPQARPSHWVSCRPAPVPAPLTGLAWKRAWLRPRARPSYRVLRTPPPGPAPLTGLARKRAWLRCPSAALALGLAQARARPRPSHRSCAEKRLAPPPRARPRAPRGPTRAQPRELRGVLTCEKKRVYPCRIDSCSRRRNRTVPSFRSSVTSLLPPQQAVEAVISVAALCFDTLASSVALANSQTDEGLTRESLMCPFCCLH